MANRTVGILSVSEIPDQLLMWAHYAENHAGLVLEINVEHEFFETEDPRAPFAAPQPIQYRAERPKTSLEGANEYDLFLAKSEDWAYEREWRYLKYLVDADVQADGDPATPGKMAIAARVVDAKTGGPASTAQYIGRYLAYYVAILPLFLGVIWVAFDPKKQGWHDKLAGTVVIRPARQSPEPVRFD